MKYNVKAKAEVIKYTLLSLCDGSNHTSKLIEFSGEHFLIVVAATLLPSPVCRAV